MRATVLALLLAVGSSLAACASTSGPRDRTPAPSLSTGARTPGTMRPYQINGTWYTPRHQPGYDETGIASWYGQQFHNRQTADGEIFDMDRPTAAHTTLPLPSIVEVTNLENNRRIRVRVNDRGPFVRGRIIDLSRAAAEELGFHRQGTARVRVRYIGPADPGRSTSTRAPERRQPERYRRLSEAERQASRTPPQGRLHVQAGAFATRAGAERAVDRLDGAAPALIEPISRDGRTLYRVILGPAPDADAADALRARTAALGFADARIIGF